MTIYDLCFFAAVFIGYGYFIGVMHACHAWRKSIREDQDRALKRLSDCIQRYR